MVENRKINWDEPQVIPIVIGTGPKFRENPREYNPEITIRPAFAGLSESLLAAGKSSTDKFFCILLVKF